MNPFKKLALIFTAVLALFAGDAMAQCSGKKVYIELPDGWGDNLYISWSGSFPRMSTTKEGNFRVFTFSGLSNDNNTNSNSFAFLNKSENYVASGIMSITRTSSTAGAIGSGPNAPTTSLFNCSHFGSTTYISLVPGSSSQVRISNDPPNTRYFYFLPPNDPEWILNTPVLWQLPSTQTKMEIDPKRCGWYRIVYFTTQPSDNDAIIVQSPKDITNPNSTNRIGAYGMAEEPQDWVNGAPTPFKLKSRFDAEYGEGKGGDLFLVSDGAKMGWSKTDPMIEEPQRCTYSFAAIIYDTDKSKNPSFTTLDDDIGCGEDQYSKWTSGIIKGMVKQNLNPTTRKIECDNCAKGGTVASSQGYFVTKEQFANAFDPKSSTNEVVCYDMPFARASDGLWEFDSDKMMNNSNKTVGGFFPEILQTYNTNDGGCGVDCRKKWPAESYVNLTDSINGWCFERGLKTKNKSGQSLNDCGSAYGPATGSGCPSSRGDFSHGDNPAKTWGATPTGDAQWDADWRYGTINIWGGSNTGKNATANQLFCFESHAEFTYEPGQEFFFRGDDDIWVYMNNKLVVDLGGTHLAAPGYVNLKDEASKLGLTEGEKYPIDIFFCDRRTGMSNVRIKTNMYFAQETGLSLETKDAEVKGKVCLTSSGGGSCADVSGTGGEKTKCGADINAGLRYYLRNRAGTAGDDLGSIGLAGSKGFLLDRNNENCEAGKTDAAGESYVQCYGGIRIYDRLGKVHIVKEDITGLAGTWQIWVTHTEENPTMKVAEFTKNVKVQIVWGEIRTDDGKLIDNLNPTNSAGVIAGKTVKIGFAAAEQSGDNKFAVLMDDKGGSPGQTFSIAGTSFSASGVKDSELTLCYDEACNNEVDRGQSNFKIPGLNDNSAGLLVLYAKGNFGAANDGEYVIKVAGSSAEFKLTVYQPRMRFVRPGTTNILSADDRRFSDPTKSGGDTDKWVWLGTEMLREIVAFDPSAGVSNESSWKPCGALCDGLTLRYTARADVDKTINRSLVDISGLTMEDGVAKLSMAGMTPIPAEEGGDDWASVKIQGPSALEETATEWTKMQFRKPPVPIPVTVELYDRYGGGRGDSLIIVYNRAFGTEEADGVYDYPTYIEVIWDENITETIGYGSQYKKDGNQYVFEGTPRALKDYWKECKTDGGLRVNQCLVNDSTIVIVRGNYDESFSGDRIKTGGDGKIVSWATFDNPDRPGVLLTTGNAKTIDEKIQPIVISATYIGGENCGTRDNPCTDNVIIDVSEPLKLAEDKDEDAIKTAFAYILRSMNRSGKFEVFNRQDDLPAIVRWKTSGRATPAPGGDSTVTLTYRAYKTETDTAFTPIASDSIRFLAGRKGEDRSVFFDVDDPSKSPLVDLNGNHPHPREWGVLITGKQRFDVMKNLIAGTGGTGEDDDRRQEILDSLYLGNGGDKGRVDTLFCTGNVKKSGKCKTEKPIELLPIPENWTAEDVKKYMPGTVGIVLKPDVVNEVQTFMTNNPIVKDVKASEIKFVANSVYHTNLGNYVVHRGPIELRCDDKIFQYGGAEDCRQSAFGGNNSGLYLAWDLKDAKGRWAGAGAYVQVYDFYWEIETQVSGQKIKSGKLNPYKKIEMYGVKRLKRSSKSAGNGGNDE